MDGIQTAAVLHRLSTVYRAETDPSRRATLCQMIICKCDLIRGLIEHHIQNQRLDHMAHSHIAYAYAHLDIRHPTFFTSMTQYLSRNIRAFHLKSLSMVAWAYAKIGGDCTRTSAATRDVFKMISQVVSDQIATADPQIISHLTWAFATLEIPAANMFTAIAGECLSCSERLERFNAQEMCILAWSFGRQHHRHDQLFARISEIARKQMHGYTPQHLQMLSLGFGELGIRDEGLLELIANESIAKMSGFSGATVIHIIC